MLLKIFKKTLYLVNLGGAMLVAWDIPGRLSIVLEKTVGRFIRAEQKHKTLWKFFLITGIFLGFFLFFFLRNHYYVPAKLHIEGFTQKPAAAIFQWDTGNGLNDYEATAFTVESKLVEKIPHRVVIERIGEKQPSAQAAEVRVLSIATDQQDSLKLASFAVPKVIDVKKNGAIALLQDQARIEFTGTFQKITIKFLKNPWSGKVRIFIDDVHQGEYDLYAEQATDASITIEQLPKPELFIRELELPQLRVYGIALKTKDQADMFSLHALKIISANGEVELPVNSGVASNTFTYPQIDPQTATFHWILFTVQVFLAGLCTYFVILFFPRVRSRQQLHVTFLAGKRWLFWCMFFIASGIFSSWLIGYWPGALSYDPISYWLSAKLISIDRAYYPMPLYILFFTQIFDSPAIVALFHILVVAGLGSYIFYFTYKNGVKFYLILPFFVAFCFSIPIGIYNIGLYNDVPFATLITFWAFFLFLSNFHKKTKNTPIKLSIVKIFTLSLFFLLLCNIRANGIVFIVFIPFILWRFKLLESNAYYKFIFISLLFFIINFGIVSATTHKSNWSEFYNHFWKIQDLSSLIDNKTSYYTDNFENDRNIIEKFVSVSEIKQHNFPANKTPIIVLAYNNFINIPTSEANELIGQLNKLYVKRIFTNFHIFLANRTYMLFASFGTFETIFHYDIFNLLENRDIFLNWWAGNHITNSNLVFSPKSKAFHETLKKLLKISIRPKYRLIIWNALPFLVVFSIISLLYKWFPMSSLYSSVILFQVFFLFLFLPASDFRYVYFIYLSGIFIFPLFFLEIICKKRESWSVKTGQVHKW
ncbi:MAG: hypothetical protein JXB42_13245 [Deltaproteobacteria bacterium]|nr:hypothetical protein [Deltaproteobacteria bacterium]